MKNTNALIIGGGPAAVVAANSIRSNYPSKQITIIRDKEIGVVPCGIPYIFNRLDSADKNIMPDKSLEANNVELIIDTAKNVDFEKKIVITESGEEINYEKLILATGSNPTLPKINGADKEGVWLVKKDLEYLRDLRATLLEKSKDVVIIGGGFIGVEFAEELSSVEGLNITVVEMLDSCLCTTFDSEFTEEVEKILVDKGVGIEKNTMVEEIAGDGKVESVKLSNGKEIPADLVILSIGAKPNVGLVKDTDIKIGMYGGIWVDEYLRTSIDDVYAIGDCSETRDFFTGKHVPIMLASTATVEARIAGSNLYKMRHVRENKGSLNAFSTSLGDTMFGAAGLTEKKAQELGYDFVVGNSKCTSHHPGSLPGTQPVIMKLIFSSDNGALLGGQVMGPDNISEMINIIAISIQERLTAYDIEYFQVSSHPLITPAPTVTPLIAASSAAIKIMRAGEPKTN